MDNARQSHPNKFRKPNVSTTIPIKGHFKKTNDWLEQRYGVDNVIDWCKLDVDAKEGGDA